MPEQQKQARVVMGGVIGTFVLSAASLLLTPTSAMATSATCCDTGMGGYYGCRNGVGFCVPDGACDPYGSGRCENEGDDQVCEWNTFLEFCGS
jgi:hypothetical protein